MLKLFAVGGKKKNLVKTLFFPTIQEIPEEVKYLVTFFLSHL